MEHPITVSPEWTSLPSQYRTYSATQLARILESNVDGLHYTEVLPLDQPVCVYFDIDYPIPNAPPSDVESLLETVTDAITAQGVGLIRSICHSNGRDKVSYHIVCGYYGNRLDVQNIARCCNGYMMGKGYNQCFDTKVYGRTQKFRLINCTKPPSGIRNCDPEQRVKRSLFGSIQDSFISYIPPGTPPLPPLFRTTTNATHRTGRGPMPNHLKWFGKVLEDPSLQMFWVKKADAYETWNTVGAALAVEVRGTPFQSDALYLFKKFSAMSSKYDENAVTTKFSNSYSTINQAMFGCLHSWVKGFNKAIGLLYDSIYQTGSGTMLSTFVAPVTNPVGEDTHTAAELADLTYGFLPANSYQYRLYAHFQKPCFYTYWKTQLTSSDDLKKVLTLIRTGNVRERDLEDTKIAQVGYIRDKLGKAVQLPYGDSNTTSDERAFLKFTALVFDLEYAESMEDLLMDEEDEKTAEAAFNSYKHALQDISTAFWDLVEQTIDQKLIIPYLQEELIDDYNTRILELYGDVVASNLLWKSRIPYLDMFQQLALLERDTPKENFDFWITFNRLAPFYLNAERYCRIFTNALNELEAARVMYAFHPYWIISPMGDLHVYDDETGIWSKEIVDHCRVIVRLQYLLHHTVSVMGNATIRNLASSRKMQEGILTQIKSLPIVKQRSATDYFNYERTGTRKLLFPNGYYDGVQDRFYSKIYTSVGGKPVAFFSWPTIMFFASVPDPYLHDEEETPSIKNEILDVMFDTMFSPEVALFYRENLCFAAFAEPKKHFIVCLGEPNSGKSTEKSMIEHSFGNGYAGTTNLDKLRFKKNNTRDSGLNFDFVYQNEKKRFLLCSELAGSKEDLMDTEMFKIVASGQEDSITGRVLYKPDAVLKPHFTLVIYLNTMFRFNKVEAAIIGRTLPFTYKHEFVQHVTDPSHQRQANDDVKTWKSKPAYRQHYVKIVIDAYRAYIQRGQIELPKPAELLADIPLYIGETQEQKQFFQRLMTKVVFHGRPDVFVKMSDLKGVFESIEEDDIHATRKVKNVINSLSLPHNTIYQKQKWLAQEAKNTYVFYGMSLRDSLIQTGNRSLVLTDYEQWVKLMREGSGVIREEVVADLEKVDQLLHGRKRYRDAEAPEFTEEARNLIEKYITPQQREDFHYTSL